MYLDVSSFFDCLNELELEKDLVTSDVNTRDGTYNHINHLHSINQALVIIEGAMNQASSFLLERQQQLHLLDIDPNLRPVKHVRLVPGGQAGLHQPLSQVSSPSHDQNLAFLHFLVVFCFLLTIILLCFLCFYFMGLFFWCGFKELFLKGLYREKYYGVFGKQWNSNNVFGCLRIFKAGFDVVNALLIYFNLLLAVEPSAFAWEKHVLTCLAFLASFLDRF